ncbi:hypothetical protein EAO71_34150 [Streptomyces sp. ms191]|uniref:hypothetical protein n=1 Tax=unclassified Streptomyces TaxID=2593676 RepID=UPI0011CDB465|nr:hypothetical protein [Streptomyces sp. ms191]TXS16750.1 hypothetical protein EAO71_34150 [Streptomyces sp. ms191]
MKLRHVRAVAVFGIALVALTGARGSHGGSCGGSSHSGSGSSSSGSHGNDTNDSTGGSTGGVSAPGGSSANKAVRDVRIDDCKLDASGKNLVARLTVTNNGSLDYTYGVTMEFRGAAGSGTARATARVTGLSVKAGASQQTEATTAYPGKADGSEYKECVVVSATKNAL